MSIKDKYISRLKNKRLEVGKDFLNYGGCYNTFKIILISILTDLSILILKIK